MGVMIKISGKKYEFDFDNANVNELSKSLAYLEIIKQKLIVEIEKDEKKYEEEEK